MICRAPVPQHARTSATSAFVNYSYFEWPPNGGNFVSRPNVYADLKRMDLKTAEFTVNPKARQEMPVQSNVTFVRTVPTTIKKATYSPSNWK